MDSTSLRTDPLPPLEDLPAVERPSSSFFLQLFLMPALIVFGIVLVWFLFGKLAGAERSVHDYVDDLGSGNRHGWKAAHDLSCLLRNDSSHTRDVQLAVALTTQLQKRLAESVPADPENRKFLEYLTGAVGSFQLPIGVPALRQAAKSDQAVEVRRVAILSLADLAHRIGDLEDPNVVFDLRDYLAAEDDSDIRELTAFALGFMNDKRAIPALEAALNDSEASVRFNSATSLASLGSTAGVPVIAEMLDLPALRQRFQATDRDGKPIIDESLAYATVRAGLRSVSKLMDAEPEFDYKSVLPALERLATGDDSRLQVEANLLLRRYASRAPDAAAQNSNRQ